MLRVRPVSVFAVVVAAVSQLTACGGADPEPTTPKQPTAKKQPKDASSGREGQIDRRRLDLVLLEGPGWVYEHFPIEEVLEKGKFIGWRIQQVPEHWGPIDLQPGDIVTAVNGMPLEKPDDFWSAWSTLSVASELKVTYQRDGEDGELNMPIYGQPDPRLAERFKGAGSPGPGGAGRSHTLGKGKDKDGKGKDAEPLPPRPRQPEEPGAKRKGTITIKSREKPYNESPTVW